MNHRCLILACAATLLFGMPAVARAQSLPDGTPGVVGGMESTAKSKKRIADRRKAVAKTKTVDINSASVKQLKKLPGIGDAEAKRIVAGRPYGSKAWLVTKGIIGEGPYSNIKNLIVAKQPYDDLNKNAAVYEKAK